MTPGDVFEERFESPRAVGSGGMGTIFRARDRREGGFVAVKVLRGADALDVERFSREASILARLSHPGIVRYITDGVTAAGEHYLAMEWLEGEDLATRLASRPVSVAETLTLVRRAAEALAFAHARGLVHRDLKPSNLFLVGGEVDRVKLVDFGIARLGRDTGRLTRTGVLLGTPGYMSPEQIQGPPAYDPRADVFSLGCVFFECLAGRPAFEGMNAMAVLAKILLQEVPHVRVHRPNIAEPLDELVARMMAKDADLRPRDAADVLEELARLGDPGTISLSPHPAALRTVESGDPPPSGEPASGPASGPSSLTLSEQRLVSVVLAGDPDTDDVVPGASRPGIPALQAAIDPFGGHIDALAGGSLVVTLWSSGSSADRAERAAQCALTLKARFGTLPVCVVTGRGLVSAHVVGGEVIDRGVRTLSMSRPGAVHVDEVTAGMLTKRFRVDRDGASFILQGERAAAEGAPLLLGHTTSCIGRGRELSMLEGVFSGCIAEPVASAVLVVGAAGAGKSRLRREFLEKLRLRAERVEILAGTGDSLGAGAPFRMIADALRRAAGFHDGEPLPERRRKLAARLGRHLDRAAGARAAAFLGELTGTPFPDEGNEALRAARDNPRIMGDAMQAAWEDFLAAECAVHPVLLVLEDLHWGDAATVRLIDATLRNLRELPLMILVLGRPEVTERFPHLWAEREIQVIKLGPLSRRASEQLVRGALGSGVPEAVVARILDRAGGNPFYLEELVRAVADGRADVLPDSVLGMVEARLDTEESEAKRVLRAASIFGDRFSRLGVIELLGGERRHNEVASWLHALAARELIAPAGATAGGEARYVFCHALVREAAYAMLTPADRALGHRLAGSWLERAEHTDALEMAEHFRLGAEPARAVRWYRRAAEKALEANELGAAVERAARGVECGAEGEDLGDLRLIQAEADVWRGELTVAERRALEAAALLSPGGAAWFRAVTQAVIAAGKLGGYERVEERVAMAAAARPAPGARSAQLICLCECASYLVFGGRCAAADPLIERIRRVAPDPASLEAPVAALLQQVTAIRASFEGDAGVCLEGFMAAQASFEGAGDHRNACAVRANLGFIFAELGDFESAEEALRAALAGAERMGLAELSSVAMQHLGYVLASRGQLDGARLHEERAIEAFHRAGDRRMEGLSRAYLARISLLAGDLALAEREAATAVEMLAGAPPLRAAASAALARVLLRLGRSAEALPIAREGFATLQALGGLEEGEAKVRLVYAQALLAEGETEAFAEIIAEARERLLERAGKISDPAWRERFLTVPDNARTLALAR
jgi:serine/threonine protein kinase/tetratricopeptide (TPR) repeat protein